ncbi:hypothetical protein F2Q70_00002842, partial [Brassica cretica]
GTYIVIMATLNQGQNRYVLIVYRNAVAALVLGPFAIFFERKVRPKMTLSVFWKIVLLGFLDPKHRSSSRSGAPLQGMGGWMGCKTFSTSLYVSSGLTYYVQGMVMRTRGPVFVTAFNPLCMILVALLASFILHEQIHYGCVIGGTVIAMGLYLVVWGKGKDYDVSVLAMLEKNSLQELPFRTQVNNDDKLDSSIDDVSNVTFPAGTTMEQEPILAAEAMPTLDKVISELNVINPTYQNTGAHQPEEHEQYTLDISSQADHALKMTNTKAEVMQGRGNTLDMLRRAWQRYMYNGETSRTKLTTLHPRSGQWKNQE